MVTETRAPATEYDGRLFELYTKYVSEPESKKDVYGYTLLVIGYLLALIGMLIYFAGPTGSEVSQGTVFLVRELAAIPAGIGLVSTLFGIVLMLPVTRGSLAVTVIGALAAVVAIVLFSIYYPNNWQAGTPSYSGLIISLYSVGMAIVAGVVIMVPVVTGKRSYFSETTDGHRFEHPDIMIGESDRGGLFALFKQAGEWRWRFIDQSAVAGSTSTYLSRLEAEERVEAVKEQVAGAGLLEIKHAAFRLYESADGVWHWYLMREDGSVTAEGGEQYPQRDGAESSINAMKDHGPDAELFVMDEAAYDVQRRNGGWAWRLVDQDREPLALGAEEQTNRERAIADKDEFQELAADAMELIVEAYGIELVEVDDAWHWRLRDRSHTQLAESRHGYGSKGVAENQVYELLDRFQGSSVLEVGTPTYDVYEEDGVWQWRMVDDAGSTVVTGAHEETTVDAATSAAERMRSEAGDAPIVEMENLEFETYQDGEGWHWRLVTPERDVKAHSTDTYDSETAANGIVDRVRDEAPNADLIEFEQAAFQVYEADGGAWRWRLIDEDGTVLADSGQGEYESKADAMGAMTTLQENAPNAEHLEIENAAFELFQDDDGWGWRLVDDIGDTIADAGDRHDTEDGARDSMESLIASVSETEERTMTGGMFQVYADSDDEWWWRFVLPDGSLLAQAPSSFGTRHAVEDALEGLRTDADGAPVEVVGQLAVLLDPEDWRWELVDADRQPVATGQRSHKNRKAAIKAIEDIQRNATGTTVYEIRDAAFDCYRTDEGWTWRLIDADHDVLASAPGEYETLAEAEDALSVVSTLASRAELIDYDDVAFELYETDDGWTWRFIDEDRQVIATGERHHESRADAEDDLDEVREEITAASVLEIDSAAFEFHQTDDGWRWRLVDDSGAEMAQSIQTFQSRSAAQDQLTMVKELGPDAWVSAAE